MHEWENPPCGVNVPVVFQVLVCLISPWWCLYFIKHRLVIIRKRTQVMSLINGDQVLKSPAGSGHFVNSHKKIKSRPFWRLWIQTTKQGRNSWKAKQNQCLMFLLWLMSCEWCRCSVCSSPSTALLWWWAPKGWSSTRRPRSWTTWASIRWAQRPSSAVRSRHLGGVHVCLVAQSCLTLRLHGLQPARLLCPGNSPGNNTGVGCHSFPTQGSNPGLLHCSWIIYRLSHQGPWTFKLQGLKHF